MTFKAPREKEKQATERCLRKVKQIDLIFKMTREWAPDLGEDLEKGRLWAVYQVWKDFKGYYPRNPLTKVAPEDPNIDITSLN